MKTLITVSALALVSNLASAENFAYERQISSPDLSTDLGFNGSDPKASAQEVHVSLNDFYRGNPDVENVSYEHDGIIIRGAVQFTAYDELSQQNPDLGGV